MGRKPAARLDDVIEAKARTDGGFAIAYALLRLAEAQERIAHQVKYLGNGDAFTPMGAIEAFSKHIGEKLDALTDALGNRDG